MTPGNVLAAYDETYTKSQAENARLIKLVARSEEQIMRLTRQVHQERDRNERSEQQKCKEENGHLYDKFYAAAQDLATIKEYIQTHKRFAGDQINGARLETTLAERTKVYQELDAICKGAGKPALLQPIDRPALNEWNRMRPSRRSF